MFLEDFFGELICFLFLLFYGEGGNRFDVFEFFEGFLSSNGEEYGEIDSEVFYYFKQILKDESFDFGDKIKSFVK